MFGGPGLSSFVCAPFHVDFMLRFYEWQDRCPEALNLHDYNFKSSGEECVLLFQYFSQ